MKRCRADEALLNDVLGKRKKGFIIDTWAKGKSNSETDLHYTQWKKINRSIGNILSPSSILDSFAKLVEGRRIQKFPVYLANNSVCFLVFLFLFSVLFY